MFWLILVVLTTVAYILLFRQWAISRQWWIWIPIIVLAVISLYGYYQILSTGQLGVVYAIATGSIIALLTIGSVLIFHERPTLLSWIGLFLLIVGVTFLAIPF